MTEAVRPRISVALTTHNGSPYIEEQLRSILEGTVLPDEIVIGDDASSDETWAILERIAAGSPVAMHLHRHAQNVGLARNFEFVLERCRGELVAVADHDDVWEPGKLARAAAAFADPQVMLWCCDATLIDHAGQVLARSLWEAIGLDTGEREALCSGRGLGRLIHGSALTGTCLVVRDDVARMALPFPERVGGPGDLYFEDAWLALVGALRGAVVLEPERLVRYRQHETQITAMALVGDHAPERGGPVEGQLALDHARVRVAAERCRRADVREHCAAQAVHDLFELEGLLSVRTQPRGTRGRSQAILRQLAGGAYGRYARGFRTALRDLFLGPRGVSDEVTSTP